MEQSSQEFKDGEHPIAFYIKLDEAQHHYMATEKEA